MPARFGHKDRLICGVCGRRGIAFSTIETNARRYYESVENVVDIREQYPLDRETTRAIARELGIQHPRDPESLVDIVMTTDLVLTYRSNDGQVMLLPRSCKVDGNLHDFNQAEHAEIERRYWLREGWLWRFVTEAARCQPRVMVENLSLLSPARFKPEVQPYSGYFDELCDRLVAAVVNYHGNAKLGEFGATYQSENGLAPGEATRALLYLIFRHRLRGDIVGSPLIDQRVVDIAAATIARPTRTRRSA